MAAYYVRTDGSDSNDGSANDAAHAFLTVAHAAAAALTSGDKIFVAVGTFAEGGNQVLLANGVSLFGAGVDLTIITSTIDAQATNHAIVKPGNNSEVAYLTITGTKTDGTFQTPFGSITGDAAYTNAWLHDAKLTADSDGINAQAGCVTLAERVTFNTKFDAITASGASTQVEIRNCTVSVNGPSATGSINRACGAFCGPGGRFVAIDSAFNSVQSQGATGAALGVDAVVSAKATVIGCTLSTSSDGATTTDLAQTGSAVIRVNSSTYSTTSGTITANPATLTRYRTYARPGDPIDGTYTGITPTGASIATQIDFGNAVNLSSFVAANGLWSAIIPTTVLPGHYSVRISDASTFYSLGTLQTNIGALGLGLGLR